MPRPFPLRPSRGAIGLALLLAGVPACRSCNASPAEEAAPAVVVEAPVSVPEGHIADVFVMTPNATWGKLQRGIGGAAGILPSTLGGLVCAFSGLDASLGPEIDGTAPIAGVVADGAQSEASWAVALKLVEPRRARDVLLEGDAAHYGARPIGTMTQLVPKGGSLPVAAALANGGYLVLARSDADLARLGPYAYRTLATKAVPAQGGLVAEIPSAALKGVLRGRLEAMWTAFRAALSSKDDAARAQHGGRAPDYGDPKAILAALDTLVQDRLAVVADLERARVVVDVDDGSVRLDVTMTPATGGGPAKAALASLRPGDAAPILGDDDSPLSVLLRDDAAGRAQTADALEATIAKALATRLAEPEEKRLRGAFEGWTKARGDWVTFGLLGTDGFYTRAAVTNAGAADRATKNILETLSAAPLKQILRIRDVKVGAGTATVSYGESKGGDSKKAEVTWSAANGELFATIQASGAKDLPVRKLGDDPVVVAEVKALEANITFAAVVQPLKLDPVKTLLPPAPLVLAWGRKGDDIWAHACVSDALVRELLRSF